MEKSNFIEVQQAWKRIDEVVMEHLGNVSKCADMYNNLGKSIKTALPSEAVKAYNDLNKAQEETAKSAQLNISVKDKETLANANLAKSINTTTKAYRQELGSLGALVKQNAQYQRELKKTTQELNRLNKLSTKSALTNSDQDKKILSLSTRQKELRIALAQSNQELNAYMKEITATDGSMNQMSATLGQLRMAFRGLSSEQREGALGQQMQSDIRALDSELKKLDGNIGNYQRNVGNYTQQWDGLRHETNQLIREVPAMAYGVNVFFGAISNNLPMFIDQVKRARLEQKAMLAEGKQAPSVISRITSALFNWQTAIILGITYLTLHGKEIWNWVKSLVGAETSIKNLNKSLEDLHTAQENYAQTTVGIITKTEQELTVISRKVEIINDLNKSESERIEKNKELMDMYPGYFQNLGKEGIMLDANGRRSEKAIEALQKLRNDMKLRIEAEEKYAKMQENLNISAKLLQEAEIRERANKEMSKSDNRLAKERIRIRKEQLDDDAEFTKLYGKLYLDANGKYAEVAITDLRLRAGLLKQEVEQEQREIERLMLETSLLDYKPSKEKKERNKAEYDYISALAQEYELMKLIYEQSIQNNKVISDDETKTYDQRAIALMKMYEDEKALNELNKKESVRLLEIQLNEELTLLKKAGLSKIETYAQEQEIYQKNLYERNIIDQNYFAEKQRIDDEIAKGLDVQIKKLWEYNQAMIDISRVEQNRVSGNINEVEQLNFKNVLKDYEKIQKERTNIAEDAEKERLELFIKSKDIEMAELGSSSADYQKLANEKIQAENQLEAIRERNAKAEADRIRKLAQDYKNFMQGFQNQVMNEFPAIQKMISDDFQKMINDLIESGNTAEALTAVGLQMVDAFQDIYNQLQVYSDAYYNQQYERLEMQRDVAIKFAGESATAREEVERQYDRKRKQIEREQAKRQKDQAIFNAIINTAQAVVAALANPGGPAGVALSVLVGVLGAAQIAMISSQPLPAFAEGGTHSGGAMLVNDGKGSNYRETVVTPDGKIMKPKGRNVVMNAPKGTEIFTNDQWNKQLQGILLSNNILPPKAERGLTKEDLKEVFASQSKNDNNGVDINIDKHGFKVMQKRNGQQIKRLDSRIRIKNNKL